MSNLGPQFATKDWNPFLAASNLLDQLADKGNSQYRTTMAMLSAQNRMRNTASTADGLPPKPTPVPKNTELPATVRTTPTPVSTGAPQPGYRQRGKYITPQSTGAPMPKTNATTKTSTGNITPKHTSAYPKKIKGTAPGTRPKKK
jgi:hypothetical protein